MKLHSTACLFLLSCVVFGCALPARGETGKKEARMKARKHDHRRHRGQILPAKVLTGIEVLKAKQFKPLAGKRLGLVTNHTGIDQQRRTTIDLLAEAPGVKLVKLFSPEHGIRGELEGDVDHATDEKTGLRVLSLYGETRRPTDAMMKGLDAMVFDIQDIGARFYTYITTMMYCMEACAKHRIPLYVLDRPNPIGGVRVEGPLLDKKLLSFTAPHLMPARHGMTAGELALMFNSEKKIKCDLRVVAMEGWTRDQYWEETGVPWINTSPNIRKPVQAVLYAGVGALECTNISVGRGTDAPFEIIGAPWVKGAPLAKFLNARGLEGVKFKPVAFTPTTSVHEKKRCEGVRMQITDRARFDSVRCGLEIANALWKLHASHFELHSYAGMIGQKWVVDRIKAGVDPEAIQAEWDRERRGFLRRRAKFLVYRTSGEVGMIDAEHPETTTGE